MIDMIKEGLGNFYLAPEKTGKPEQNPLEKWKMDFLKNAFTDFLKSIFI